MKRLLKMGMRAGWHRGVMRGSRMWLIVGGVSLVGHLARRALARREDVIWSGEVSPDQVVTVRHLPPS